MAISKDRILKALPKQAKVPTPEWATDPANPTEDDFVIVQELTLQQQQAIANSLRGRKDADADATIKTFIEGVVEPAFDAADAEALYAIGAAPVQRVVARILELSGMTPKAQQDIQGK